MKQNRDSDGNFERKLLGELKAVVAERDAEQAAAIRAASPSRGWRRAPRLALAGCAVLAAATAVLVFSSGGDNPPEAFAVEPQQGGGVKIEIYSLEDASGLEAALADAGIRSQVTWLPAGKVCREPHFKPSIVRLPGGGSLGGMTMGGPGGPMTISVGSTQRWREESFGKIKRGEVSPGEMANVNLDPAAFRANQSVVLSGAPVPHGGDPEGGSIASLGVAEGPVEPCQPVPALPSGSGGPFGLTPGGGSPYVPRGDAALGQAAVAAELRHAAAVAAASDGQVEAPPGPGQLLYTETMEAHLQAWDPDGPASGSKTRPRYFTDRQLRSGGNAMPALVATLKQVWMDPDGKTRERETLDRVEFLSAGDQRRWESAGSPPPFEYDPAEHDVGRDGSGRPVKDYRSRAFRGRREFTYMSRLSQLPTEPEALRLAAEHRRSSGAPLDPSPARSQRGGGTVERLLEILSEPMASPALRAAAFEALAEIPGIGFERGVADVAGRRGDAIAWTRGEGFGHRFIFDPRTARILAEAEMIFDAKAAGYPGVPDGTVFRETAYLESGVVEG
ncbi:MAG TPA: hypothetical protein VFX85_11700 [Solirubrobacterales bacterium]|nr:hypothetical protein [Solirubrobacterales bacterium]